MTKLAFRLNEGNYLVCESVSSSFTKDKVKALFYNILAKTKSYPMTKQILRNEYKLFVFIDIKL